MVQKSRDNNSRRYKARSAGRGSKAAIPLEASKNQSKETRKKRRSSPAKRLSAFADEKRNDAVGSSNPRRETVDWQSIEKKYKEADAALGNDEPHKAEPLLRELVVAEPREPLFHWRLGEALSGMQKFHDAILEFRRALKLDPRNVAAVGCLGKAYMELGDWRQAEKAIKTRLKLKKSPQHYIFLAHILSELRRFDEAIKACNRAIAIDPTFAEAYLNLGLAYRHKKQVKGAIQAFEKAIEFDGTYALAFRELGLTYYVAGKLELAKKALRTGLALDANDAWGHLYLALCLESSADVGGAARQFVEALKRDPENPFFNEKYEDFVQQFIEPSVNGLRTK
jgi:tetratricopeptide (TPR) repeat protein